MNTKPDLIAASSVATILAILSDVDNYGYAIIKRVREVSDGGIEWTDGMLYPVLHRLERLGHIEARWGTALSGRPRKYYSLTARGRTHMSQYGEKQNEVERDEHVGQTPMFWRLPLAAYRLHAA